MSKEVISTANAPAAIGPYSQAICWWNLVFVSGQIPIDPATGMVVPGDIAIQTERVLKNLAAILEAADSNLSMVLKTTVFLKDMNEFGKMNEVYARFFPDRSPARATVEVSRLPRDVRVEIEVVAETKPLGLRALRALTRRRNRARA